MFSGHSRWRGALHRAAGHGAGHESGFLLACSRRLHASGQVFGRREIRGTMNSHALKFDLCCAARLLYRFGLSVGVAGHLSITIDENRMLVNRFGPSFGTMTPADVLTMDFHGNVLEHDPAVKPYVNETIHLHGVIHRYNPHIAAVAHTHPPNTVTWTTFRKLPQTFDQESC